jgi:ceramide glucosyltransferase
VTTLALLAWAVALAGAAQAWLAALLVRRFARAAAVPASGEAELPPITVLKPLHGDEPLLEQALASLCAQDYPTFQIVFGVQRADDPALAVVARLRARFPERDIAVVCDRRRHGENHKIGNLINMFPQARHDVLVIADSDLHMRADYLRALAATLALPETGLVTTLYAGLPATATLAGRLGAAQITEGFLPGAVLARALGRQDCLGATMMLRRETLMRAGGLEALADHLADDNRLGVLVRAQGLTVRLAPTLVATTVPETRLAPLFRHELRWARTIRTLVPVSFALSSLQYPLAWASVALAAAPGWRGLAGWAAAWAARAGAAAVSTRAVAPLLAQLSPRTAGPLALRPSLWLLPLRELLSVLVMAASYGGRRVEWRGHSLLATGGVPAVSDAGAHIEDLDDDEDTVPATAVI